MTKPSFPVMSGVLSDSCFSELFFHIFQNNLGSCKAFSMSSNLFCQYKYRLELQVLLYCLSFSLYFSLKKILPRSQFFSRPTLRVSFLSLLLLSLRSFNMHLSKKFEKRFNNLLTKEEIAIELGVSPRTIANWMSSGKIPSVRIGRRNFGLKRDIEIWIERNRRKK